MTRDLLVQICLEQPEAIEDFPLGEHVSVFKVGGKMCPFKNCRMWAGYASRLLNFAKATFACCSVLSASAFCES